MVLHPVHSQFTPSPEGQDATTCSNRIDVKKIKSNILVSGVISTLGFVNHCDRQVSAGHGVGSALHTVAASEQKETGIAIRRCTCRNLPSLSEASLLGLCPNQRP
eukprot:8680392-Pyramimonas_sp.AAC.1